MRDFEIEFISKQNQLILKYGEKEIKTIGYKAAAIQILETAFQKFPDSFSFEEEMSQLEANGLELPKIRVEISKFKQEFLFNRFSEIVNENPDHKFINKENDINKKVIAVEGIGLTVSRMLSSSNLKEQINFEVIFDLYNLYILQYGLYNQNPTHPIFLNAIIQGNKNIESNDALDNKKSESGNTGCLGFVLVMLLCLITLILAT